MADISLRLDQIRFNFWPTGPYAYPLPGVQSNYSPPLMASPVACSFGPGVPFSAGNAAQYLFDAYAPPPLIDVPAPLYGINDMFPFDSHTVNLAIRCWEQSADTLAVTEVPINVQLIGVVQVRLVARGFDLGRY